MKRLALACIAAHLAITALHAAAHFGLGVLPSTGETIFITAFIYVGPMAAAWWLMNGRERAGFAVLTIAMIGALAFATHHHFIAISPDHVAHLPPGGWRLPFQVTAIASAPVDAVAAYAGARALTMRRT